MIINMQIIDFILKGCLAVFALMVAVVGGIVLFVAIREVIAERKNKWKS